MAGPHASRTLVTIFADASFPLCNRRAQAPGVKSGLAWWYKSHLIGGRGSAAALALTTFHAELQALLAGARDAIKAHDEPVNLLLQSDSMAALGAIQKYGLGVKTKSSRLLDNRKQLWPFEVLALEQFTRDHPDLTVWLKHVKGHTGKDDTRSWVNQQTDTAAKLARKFQEISP